MDEQSKPKVLIVDDEGPIRQVLSAALKDEGYDVRDAENGEMGLQLIREFQPEVVLLDIWMPGKLDGMAVLLEARKGLANADIVMMSGHGTIETAVRATRLGAWDFIEKPLSMDKMIVTLQNLLAYRLEKAEKIFLLNRLRKNIAILGEALPMLELKEKISTLAPKNHGILIRGEVGVGKELVAQNIHYLSSRSGRAFVEFSMNFTASELAQAELFGYEKGYFPGADKTKKGRLELAHLGTLFIDELAGLSEEAQLHLLEYLKTKSLMRLGGDQKIEVDVRVLASSSKNMEDEVRTGRFNKELYELLNLSLLVVPSLRERRGDIPALLNHFADQYVREGNANRKTFSADAIQFMQDYPWPANVRELRNFVERVYILTPGDYIDVHDLHFAGLEAKSVKSKGTYQSTAELGSFRDARADFEKQYLIRKINENGGNITRTAELIGLERSYLHRKIKSYGIDSLIKGIG